MENYEIHPLMQHVPEMTKLEYEELKEDIRKNGLNEEIWVHENMIVDGRHRYKACKETDTICRFREYKGDSIAKFILSQNTRRNLTLNQKAMMAAGLLPKYEEEAKKRQQEGRINGSSLGGRPKKPCTHPCVQGFNEPESKIRKRSIRSSEQVGKLLGVGGRTVEAAKYIITHGTEEDKKDVINGQIAVNTKYDEVRERETGEKPEKRKRQESMYQKNDDPFQKILDKLKTMGKIPREEFLSTIGTKFDQMWFIGAVKSIHFISIEDCGETMELKIREDEKDLCTQVMKKLEHAKKIMSQSNRFRFDFDAINKMVQDLYDLVVVGAMR